MYILYIIRNIKSTTHPKISNKLYERIDTLWNKAFSQSSQIQQAITLLQLPKSDDSIESWKKLYNELQNILIRNRDIGYEYTFNEQQIIQMNRYFIIFSQMLDCLDLAAVSDREAIKAGMLPRPDAP